MKILWPYFAVGLALAAGTVAAWSHPEKPKTEASTAVLVELFTSEGCSSCPPADALLIELERMQPVRGAQIIVLSEHVDYWNELGWPDPFSSPAFTRRQNEYAEAFRRDGIYTPQMVVDGTAEFVGSDRARAQREIARLAQSAKAGIEIGASLLSPTSARIRIALGALPSGTKLGDAELFLAITERNLSSRVGRGENTGRTIPHTGVVRLLQSLGAAAPAAEKDVVLPAAWQRANLAVVAFVQDRRTRRILGAAIAPLPSS